ncbi:MAG: hypothetical protein ACFCUI_05480 [Bernardetiaceae bacterium]
MKHAKKIIFTLALLGCSLFVIGQDYAFRVMANKGANTLDGQNLMIGSKITTGKITVAADGYLGLAHHTGKTIELKEAGTFEVSKLDKAVADRGNDGAAARYMNFVVEELTQKNDADAMARRYRHMSKTGSAERALGDADKKIRLLIPAPYKSDDKENKNKNDKYLGNYAAVSWYINDALDVFDPGTASGSFHVVVMDLGERELFRIASEGEVVLINLADERLTGQNNFLYKVVDAKNPEIASKEHVVHRANKRAFAAEFEEFAQIPQENTALAALIRAKFFEDKGLLSDAMAAYTQAVVLAPQVQTYQTMRDAFLTRSKITKEADQERSKAEESGKE